MAMPIFVIVHPTTESGVGWFRWAVHIGDRDPTNLARCANAGLATCYEEALQIADRCAATAHTAMHIAYGTDTRIEFIRLGYEPPIGNQIHKAACGMPPMGING